MSSRHQPLNGADSASALDVACPICDATYTVYEEHTCVRLYRVKVMDLEGPAYWIEVRAIGRNAAREEARTMAEEQGAERPGVLRVEEVAA